MSFTYLQLKTAIQDYTDNAENTFINHLNAQLLEPNDTLRVDTAKIVVSAHPQDVEIAKVQIGFRGFVKLNTFAPQTSQIQYFRSPDL